MLWNIMQQVKEKETKKPTVALYALTQFYELQLGMKGKQVVVRQINNMTLV